MLSGLLISLGVIGGLLLLALLYYLINSFKERFDRNFFFTGSSVGLFLGQALLLFSLAQMSNMPPSTYGGFTELLTFQLGYDTEVRHRTGGTDQNPSEAFKCKMNQENGNDDCSEFSPPTYEYKTEWFAYTAASWSFYCGLIILLIAWIANIKQSSFWWGMFQNIVQGAVVLALSVIIFIGAVMFTDKVKKKGKEALKATKLKL